jgi:FMN phosphatase YigB (HAD superfamily)
MRASEISPKKLVVFDIDDTLVHTQTKVHVVKDGEIVNSLNSHDFTHYRLKPGEEFDFGDFRNAREFFEKSKPIIPMMNQLKRDIATGNKVVMVTARADFDDKELFLDTFRKFGIDMGKVHVYRAGNSKEGSTEERKKAIIKRLLDSGNFTKAIMYDDAKPNLHLFMELKKDHPQTKFYAWHVSLEGEASEYMRENIEEGFQQRSIDKLTALGMQGPYGKRDLVGMSSAWSKTLSGVKSSQIMVQDTGNPRHSAWIAPAGGGQWMVGAETGYTIKSGPEALKRLQFFLKPTNENFADGKKKGKSRPGRVKKAGASCKGSVTDLRARAKKYGGERGKMYHWCANMKGGRNK